MRASTKRRQLANAWWYIDFFNRWGRIAAGAPDAVLVVRYEDLQASPTDWLARISTHLGLDLDAASIDAAMTVSSRAVLRSRRSILPMARPSSPTRRIAHAPVSRPSEDRLLASSSKPT